MATMDEVLIDAELVKYASRFNEEPLALATLFPEQKKASLEIEMFKGADNRPVSAHVHSFDAETELADYDNAQHDFLKMVLIKRQFHIGEELLIRLEHTNSNPIKQEIKNEIYDHINMLVASIQVRFERMRAEIIQTGKLKFQENGVAIEIDYHMPKNQLFNSDWSTEEADPLADIEKWCDTIEDASGVRPTRVITRIPTMRKFLKNAKVRKAALGTESDRKLSQAQFNSFAQEQGYPTIGTYEGTYREQLPSGKKVLKKYIDEKSFVLLPPDYIGNTFYGPTAEEVELTKDPAFSVAQYNYITLTTYRKPDSPAKFIKASATGLPTCPYMEEVGCATIS